MSTTRASTPRIPRTTRGILQSLFLGGILGLSWMGCSFAWDSYDPRLGGEGGAGGGAAATTGVGGSGPTTGSSSTAVASSSAGTSDASSSAGTGGGSSSAGTGGDSTSSSSGTGGGGGGPVSCGGTSVLVDDFPGGDPDELWFLYSNGAVVSETGGEAVLSLPNNSPNGSWGEFDSRRAYDFREDSISIEVTSFSNPATTGQNWFGIGYDKNYLQIYQKHGTVHFEYFVDDNKTSLKTLPFDPIAHRHWRFREDGVTTFWETSSDGTSWTVMAQVPTAALFPIDKVWVWFGAGTDGGEVNPGQVHIDHVNGGGAPKEKWCPTSSIQDDFDDGVRSMAWGRSWEDTPNMMAETGGKLVITLPADDTNSASYLSASAFDLTGSSVLIEVPSAVSFADGSETRIALAAPGKQEIEMSENQGHIYFSIEVLGSWQDIGSVLYAPAQHRWWKIRESANTLYWETSPDGKAWTIQAQLSPVPIPVTALDFYIGSGAWSLHPTAGISSFDNLNLPPP